MLKLNEIIVLKSNCSTQPNIEEAVDFRVDYFEHYTGLVTG